MKEKTYVLKKTVKKKDFELLKNGDTLDLVYDITPYNCKKFRGFATICPFSLPFNDDGRICQKNGKLCDSGLVPRYFNAEIKLSKTNETIDCEVTHMKANYDNKPVFIFTVVDKEYNKEKF